MIDRSLSNLEHRVPAFKEVSDKLDGPLGLEDKDMVESWIEKLPEGTDKSNAQSEWAIIESLLRDQEPRKAEIERWENEFYHQLNRAHKSTALNWYYLDLREEGMRKPWKQWLDDEGFDTSVHDWTANEKWWLEDEGYI
jgi:hypothetical protein